MKIRLLALCVLVSTVLSAQDSTTLIFIEAGTNASDVLTPDKIYKLPNFTEGRIVFRDGNWSKALLNYNYLNGEIEFIGPKKDTLAIAKNQMLNIRQVTIDTLTYVYNDGYLELFVDSKLGKLYRRQMFRVYRRDKIGGYNQPNPSSAIESYGSYTDNYGNLIPGMKIRENITLALRTTYYINDGFNLFMPATRNNMYDMYRKKKDQIKEYINTSHVDFKSGRDLKKMFESL